MEDRLKYLTSKMPKGYYVCKMMIWCGNIGQEINYLEKVGGKLDYISAFEKMLKKLNIKY